MLHVFGRFWSKRLIQSAIHVNNIAQDAAWRPLTGEQGWKLGTFGR